MVNWILEQQNYDPDAAMLRDHCGLPKSPYLKTADGGGGAYLRMMDAISKGRAVT
jgi:hypothetical protein